MSDIPQRSNPDTDNPDTDNPDTITSQPGTTGPGMTERSSTGAGTPETDDAGPSTTEAPTTGLGNPGPSTTGERPAETVSQIANRMAIAAVEAELAAFERRDQRAQPIPRRRRRNTGGSISYSIRLDPRELAQLEERAAAIGIGPTVLGRNLIRTGLASWHTAELIDAVERLDQAVAEIRSLLP